MSESMWYCFKGIFSSHRHSYVKCDCSERGWNNFGRINNSMYFSEKFKCPSLPETSKCFAIFLLVESHLCLYIGEHYAGVLSEYIQSCDFWTLKRIGLKDLKSMFALWQMCTHAWLASLELFSYQISSAVSRVCLLLYCTLITIEITILFPRK